MALRSLMNNSELFVDNCFQLLGPEFLIKSFERSYEPQSSQLFTSKFPIYYQNFEAPALGTSTK